MAPDPLDLLFQPTYAPSNNLSVGFELSFTWTPRSNAAAETLEVGPLARKAGQQVLQLGKLNLKPALTGPGAPREDVQDKRSSDR